MRLTILAKNQITIGYFFKNDISFNITNIFLIYHRIAFPQLFQYPAYIH